MARPKLLFLACYFAPVQGSACVRTWNIAKYLARSGWDVTVVTPDPSVWRHVEDPERVSRELDREGVRRILTGHRWRCLFPDDLKCWNRGLGWVAGGVCRKITRGLGVDKGIGWISEADRACASLTSDDVDVILASGPPFASFALAKRLADRLERPYVLDYRDPWMMHADSIPWVRQTIRHLEWELIEGASAVIAISDSLLDGRFELKHKMHVITNGFDPEELACVRRYEFGHFAIVYAGIFLPPKRVITPVMVALRRLKDRPISQLHHWRFHYYGPNGDHVHEEAVRLGVMDRVVLHGRVMRAEALSAIRGAGVAVVITSVLEDKAVKDRGIVTGKLFEPLGLGVPVLLVGPFGADVEAIAEATGLVRIVPAKDIDGMASFFTEVMSGQIPKANSPETYAWPNIIKKLDVVLRSAMRPSQASLEHASCSGC